MNSEAALGGILNNAVETAKQKLLKELEGKSSPKKIDTLVAFMRQEMSVLNKKIVNEGMATIYDKYYTDKEIKELIAFYKSPVGKKTIDLTPEIMQESMKLLMQKYIPEYLEQIQKKVKLLFNEQAPLQKDKI